MKKIIIIIILLIFPYVSSYPQTVSDILEYALPSVVTVAIFKTEDASRMLGFVDEKMRGDNIDIAYEKILDLSGAKSTGSGFVIERNGEKYVITNAHVIDNASSDKGSIVAYTINRTKYDMELVGGDTFYDIAVLKFLDIPGPEINTIDFRNTEVRIGEQVYALGNPLGDYPYSVSDGIISGKNRIRKGIMGKFGFLQTTATIIWGNSGGPLFDNNGKIIGIVNAKHVLAENATYAVKSSYLMNMIESLQSKPTLQTVNTLSGKNLTSQVKLIKDFVFIIEVN